MVERVLFREFLLQGFLVGEGQGGVDGGLVVVGQGVGRRGLLVVGVTLE